MAAYRVEITFFVGYYTQAELQQCKRVGNILIHAEHVGKRRKL